MNKLQEQIPLAIQAIKTCLCKDKEKQKVAKEYKGYISSFGASIQQAGLLPTLSFFHDTSKKERLNLMNAILYVIDRGAAEHKQSLLHYTLKRIDSNCRPEAADYSFALFSHNREMVKKAEKEILQASVAIKLALRSFIQETSNAQ